MKQPALGLVATALIIALSFGLISLFSLDDFSGWVSYMLICLIPMEIVVGVIWGANPAFASKMSQPGKGLVLVLVCVVAAAVIGPIAWQITGAGMSPPPPMMMICTITSVIITFCLTIMFGGWPFTSISKNPVVAGLLLWVSAYVINYILFRVFFDFSFLAGAPVYVASLDPGGLFHANRALVFYLCTISIMFLLLHFDLWPLTTSPAIMKQPTLGILWTALSIVLGGALFYLGVFALEMNPLTFMIAVPIPFIFGTIVVLNMLQNSLFAKLQQPVKGIANAVAAAVVGTALAKMYTAVGPSITANLKVEPSPGDDFERWLASALLAVTFPFLIFYADFFKMWPLTKAPK
ncbi:MAG: hypothetical protein ABIR70_20085 [Bryobacteraceae bacterium]